ncbi:restriction endonuclease [Streptomyces lavendofoliae]|uniref:restriction endonuclease n=1 Tax=Streptomyces lavendofoliae TaxID=67314 RepID=UPI003D90263F
MGGTSDGRPGVRELMMVEVDASSWQEFEMYVPGCAGGTAAETCRQRQEWRLGRECRRLPRRRRKLVVQCKKYSPHRSVSWVMQKFVGTTRLEHGADVALFVTTCRAFTKARWAWPCARASWPSTVTCWAPGSKALTWKP